MVYTRYADDINISCVQKFNPDKMTKYIQNVFKTFGAPWILKPEKTHYGSKAGHDFMLGLCLNAQNDVTVGWRVKRDFKAMTANLIMDYKNNKTWPPEDVAEYAGRLSYYKNIEPEYFNNLIERFEDKFKVNLKQVVRIMQNTIKW